MRQTRGMRFISTTLLALLVAMTMAARSYALPAWTTGATTSGDVVMLPTSPTFETDYGVWAPGSTFLGTVVTNYVYAYQINNDSSTGYAFTWEINDSSTPGFISETDKSSCAGCGGVAPSYASSPCCTILTYATVPGGGSTDLLIIDSLYSPSTTNNAIFASGLPSTGVGDNTLPFPGSTKSPSVPEPSTWAMMLLGFAGLGYAGYRASRRTTVAA